MFAVENYSRKETIQGRKLYEENANVLHKGVNDVHPNICYEKVLIALQNLRKTIVRCTL